jgi:urea transporter
METKTAEEHAVYGEVEPEAAHDEVGPEVAHGEVEPEAAHKEVDVEAEERLTVFGEIRATFAQLKRLQGIKGEGFTDAVLRGLGQVVFQNNPLTGLLILLAISVNSFVYAGAALFGAVVGTATAKLLRIENKLVRDGLFGFNGALTAIAMVAYASSERVHGDLPGGMMMLYIALAAGFSTILARAFAFLIRNDRVPGFNFPYCIATLLLLGAMHQFGGAGAGTLHPVAGAPLAYAGDTWLYGIATGISQIFLQDNWLTGVVVVAAIAVNSRIAALAVVAGAAVAVATGCLLGESETVIRSGALGYNAALTALALGGFFVLLDRAGALYAVLGAVLTTLASAGLGGVLGASGLPVLTLPFVVVAGLMLLAARGLPALRTVPLEYAISPENTRHRFEPRAFAQAPAVD